MVAPTGDLTPLDAATMAIEMTSLGVGVRNVKRFHVLNPTSIPYEFMWESVPVPGRETEVPVFTAATPRGVVSAGRRYEMLFEFTPRVDKTQESFWNFRVPSQVCILSPGPKCAQCYVALCGIQVCGRSVYSGA